MAERTNMKGRVWDEVCADFARVIGFLQMITDTAVFILHGPLTALGKRFSDDIVAAAYEMMPALSTVPLKVVPRLWEMARERLAQRVWRWKLGRRLEALDAGIKKPGACEQTSGFEEEEKLLLEGFVGGLPAGNASGEVFHVCVAELAGGVGGGFVSAASRAAAVGDDEGALVGGERTGEGAFLRGKVDCAGDVAVGVGGGSVHVDDCDLLVSDGLFEVGDADVREFGGKSYGGD
jgi:hypothetical protein